MPETSRPPSVLAGDAVFDLDLDLARGVARVAFLEFGAGGRAAAGIERCEVSLSGSEDLLPTPNASFELAVDEETPTLESFSPDWADRSPRFGRCTPTPCDSVSVQSDVLADQLL